MCKGHGVARTARQTRGRGRSFHKLSAAEERVRRHEGRVTKPWKCAGSKVLLWLWGILRNSGKQSQAREECRVGSFVIYSQCCPHHLGTQSGASGMSFNAMHLSFQARLLSLVNTTHDVWSLQALYKAWRLQFSTGSHFSLHLAAYTPLPFPPSGNFWVCLWFRLVRAMPQVYGGC